MASLPPEVLGQVIAGLRNTYYATMSIMMLFIWDCGESTNHIFNRITPLTFGSLSVGPVILFDQEVSPLISGK